MFFYNRLLKRSVTLIFLFSMFLFIWAATPATSFAASCQVPSTHATIQTAVDDPTCGNITLATGTFVENIIISRSIKIVGSGSFESVIDGNDAGTVITIQSGLTVSLTNLTIQNGLGHSGGGIFNDGSHLRLKSIVLVGNDTIPEIGSKGGGLYNNGGHVIIKDSTLDFNIATASPGGIVIDRSAGGGIYNTGQLTIKRSLLSNNLVIGQGGSLYNEASGDVIIKYSTFAGGQASDGSTHIFNNGGTVRSQSSLYTGAQHGSLGNMNNGLFISKNDSFIDNGNFGGPGGAFLNEGTLKVRNCLFDSNHASYMGGAIYNDGTTIAKNCTFVDNMAGVHAGAIFNGGDFHLKNAAVINNTTGGNGGGIVNEGTLTIKNTTFSGNQATDFDNVWNTGNCTGCPS